MDKINIRFSLENTDMKSILWKLEEVINELIEGYNELKKQIKELNASKAD